MPEMAPAGADAAQPPFGSSAATQPTPNRGYEAAGLQRLGVVIRQMQDLVPLLGVDSEPGKAVLEALGKLAKHVPPGSVTPAAEQSALQNAQIRSQQSNQQMQALRAMLQQRLAGAAGGAAGGAGGMPGAGGPPAAAMAGAGA